VENFTELAVDLARAGASRMVGARAALRDLLAAPEQMRAMGEADRQVAAADQDSLARTWSALESLLP
jgi:hypothetical protein